MQGSGGGGRDGIPKRGSQQGRAGGGGGGGGGGPKKIVISGLSIQEKVELKKAENAWKPSVKKASAGGETNGDTEDPLQELLRRSRAILNKLTPQKFEKLVESFNELPIDTEEKLKACMELVFEKAVDEPGFSVAYARMCEVLQRKQVVSSNGTNVNFRKLLITRCQQEFEKDYMEGLDKKSHEESMEKAENEEKRKEIRLAFEEKERLLRRR